MDGWMDGKMDGREKRKSVGTLNASQGPRTHKQLCPYANNKKAI